MNELKIGYCPKVLHGGDFHYRKLWSHLVRMWSYVYAVLTYSHNYIRLTTKL